jgi:hypothetical protein
LWSWRRQWPTIATHLRDRTRKHGQQAKAKKHLTDDFCFHLIYFLSLFWPSLTSRHWELFSGLYPFLRKILADMAKKVYRRPLMRLRGSFRLRARLGRDETEWPVTRISRIQRKRKGIARGATVTTKGKEENEGSPQSGQDGNPSLFLWPKTPTVNGHQFLKRFK